MPDMTRAEAERLLDRAISASRTAHQAHRSGWPKQTCDGYDKTAEESRAAVLAAMTSATPPGWKLVPETPTPDQLRAAASAFNEAPLHSLDGQTFTLSEWRAIISPFAAAPEAP